MKGKKSIPKKKGFYVALYSCIGIVLASAGVIAYNAGNTTLQPSVPPVQEEYAEAESIDPSDLAAVNQTNVRSYLDLEEDTAFFKPKEDDTQEENATPEENTSQEDKPVAETETTTEEVSTDDESTDTTTTGTTESTEEVQETTNISEETYEVVEVITSDVESVDISSSSQFELASIEGVETGGQGNDEIIADPVFNIFSDNQLMSWPIVGDILMDFSIDRTIYDVTLEQFRTSDSISIQANAGEIVRSAAEGIVREITNTRVDGVSVVVEHGNGWVTTYSQLEEELFISEGDVLLEGQRIGVVAEPSVHRINLGNHVGFAVTRDGVPQDPKAILVVK